MEAGQDASLFLGKILEELDSKRSHASSQDLCRWLCARFDLPQLARLRSVLFYTACLDPGFPATLVKDKMKGPGSGQHSKKVMVAADIITIFNLIQMTGGAARDKRPAAGRLEARPTEVARDSRRPEDDAEVCQPLGCRLAQGPFGPAFPAPQPSPSREVDCTDCPQCAPAAAQPGFLLGVGKEAEARAPYTAAGPQPCEMQRTYFPMTPDSESVSDQDSLPGPPGGVQGTFIATEDEEEVFGGQSCLQKRTLFKGDFHSLLAVSPGLVGPADEAETGHGDLQNRKEPPKAPFLNHSFDVPYSSRYLNAAVYSPVPDKRRAKHESLDDLQASTYFGPTPAMGTPDARRCPGGRPGKQTPWPAKSWSLNTEEDPNVERPFFPRNPSYEKLQRYPSPCRQAPGFPARDQRPAYLAPTTTTEQQPLLPVGYVATANGLDAPEMASPVAVSLEEREPGKKVKDKGISGTGGQLSSDTSSVGTQTEQPGLEPKPRQDLQAPYGDRHAKAAVARRSDDDSEIVSDDISDIFRFLDDMSLSGSTGVIHSSCCDSTGSLSQLPRSDGDSSPECGGSNSNIGAAAAKLAGELPGSQGEKGKRGPDRSGGSGHRSEEELKTSVCKLVLRIGEIERKLESLSGVRDEISQVLGKLNQLDRKMQPPEARGQADLNSLTSGAPSDESASPRGFRARSGSRGGPKADGGGADWCCSDASGSNSESLRVKALKRSLFARPSSRSLTEENSATESKIASISNSPRDWRTITYANRLSLDQEEEEEEVRDRGPGESKGWRRKPKEADRQYDGPPQHRRPKPPRDFLVEQVFSPHPYPTSLKPPLKSNPLYTDLRLTELAEVRRGQPSWAGEEYARSVGDKGKLAALDLQTQESLNPNHLEYWLEDIYTPGYDSLLKRKEAEFRRARVCKLAALVAAAACTVVLVIVVPLCTMKS